jgi:CubicO group peptidase (beta-lactamase class C family)
MIMDRSRGTVVTGALALLLAALPYPSDAQQAADPPQAQAPAGLTEDQVSAIDSLFARFDDTRSPGCTVGVVRDGALSWARGYGMANLEHGVPLDSRSVFRMGSVGKQFTAGVVALLALEGRVDLDADIRTYLPELPDFGAPITTRHLLHHTSGYRDYLVLMDLAGKRLADYYDDAELYGVLSLQRELNFPPGDEFLYSNSGYFLLSQLVLRVTGNSLAEEARKRIFEPLGMEDTHYHDDHRRVVPRRATGYVPSEWAREFQDSDPSGGHDYLVATTTLPMIGDGGVFSSVEEMVPWVSNLMAPASPLGQEWHDLMLTRGVLNDGSTLPYAFGLGHGTQRGVRTLSHGGSFVGYRADVLTYPDHGVGVVTLCNRADVNPTGLGRGVGEILLAEHMEPPEEMARDRPGAAAREEQEQAAVSLTPERLAALEGVYHSPELAVDWTIRLEGEALRVRIGPHVDSGARALAPDRLELRGSGLDGVILRIQEEGSRITGFLVDAGRVKNLRFDRK